KPGQGKEPGQGKGAGQGPPTPAELAKEQQKLIDATKAAQQSQAATQAAQAALGQAQAQAPQAVQPNLDKAAQDLAKANQELGKGQPGDAAKSQQGAINEMKKGLDALNEALAQKGQPGVKPGENPTTVAQAKPGMGEKP